MLAIEICQRETKDLPLSEKVKVLDLIKKGNKSHAEVAKRSMVRMNLLSVKL